MALNFSGVASFKSGDFEIATISAAGVLDIPSRPSVWATLNANGAAVGADIVFNVIGYNNGNCYNTSNGRFTAPTSGVYFVFYRQLAQHASALGHYIISLYINGTSGWLSSYSQKPAANLWQSLSFRTFVYLNAGDYLTLRYDGGIRLCT